MNMNQQSTPFKVASALQKQKGVWRAVTDRALRTVRELPHEQPKRIILFGLGSSHFAAHLSAFAMCRDRSRPRVPLVACSSTSVGNDVLPSRGDWAIAFSHRGKSESTVKAMQAFSNAGAFNILVCGDGAEEPQNTDCVVKTVPLEDTEPHTISLTSAICAVTSLLLGGSAAEDWWRLANHPDPSLEQLREAVGRGPSLILGEWEGEWLAREFALKLMEMARVPVRAFSSEEFFHGPRYSAAADEAVWHLAMPGDRRTQEIQAVRRIEVRDEFPLSFMDALVELQWSAMAVALNRGHNPDTGEKTLG